MGIGILDILNQSGQFLAGRNAAQAQAEIAKQERDQKAALQQALLEQYKANAEESRARAAALGVPKPPSLQEQMDKATGQLSPYVNKQTPEGFDQVGAQVSDAIAHLGLPNVDPTMLYNVAQKRADELAKTKSTVQLDNGNIGVMDVSGNITDTGKRAYHEPKTPQYVTGPDNKLVVAAPGVEVRPPSGGGGTLGGVTQKKAAALYATAKDGYDRLEGLLKDTGKSAPGYLEQQGAKLPFGIGNEVASPYVRQLNQASNQLSEGWLRLTSGAQINQGEIEQFAQTFKPLAGDENDPATVAAKAAGRRKIIEAMRLAAGMPGLDVPSGLREAGIDPTDVDAVAAWVKANTSSNTAPAPVGAPADLRSKFRARAGLTGGG